MKNRYGLIYEDAMNLIEKHETRDPELILKDRNVHLLPFTGETHALGMYVIIKRNRFVFYNPSIDDNFKRMMFAHELGHDLYHREEAKEGLSEFTLFDVKSSLEYEANLFASHLLLDEEEIIDYGKMDYDLEQIAQNMRVNINLLLFKFYGMNKLGYDFNLNQSLDRKFFKNIDGKKQGRKETIGGQYNDRIIYRDMFNNISSFYKSLQKYYPSFLQNHGIWNRLLCYSILYNIFFPS